MHRTTLSHESEWKKPIPKQRDRMQSQWLVGVVGSMIVGMTGWTLLLALPVAGQFPVFVAGVFGISLTFALLVLMLRAATPAGAACGGMICLLLIYWTGSFPDALVRTAVTPLAVLFGLTFLATQAGRQRKAAAGLAEGRNGRSASQVIANLGAAALCVTPWMATALGHLLDRWSSAGVSALGLEWTLKIMCLGALAEAAADTVSSELGQAYGGVPRMLLSWRRVEAGTDGAVSALGTGAGVMGAAIVALAGGWAMHLGWHGTLVAAVAGAAGLFFDSLLGATVERRGWVGNDLVNFTSTVFAACFAAAVYRSLVL